MTATSTTRKAIRAVRRHIRTDFEHDLVSVVQADRARVAVAADAVQVHAHGSVEREQAFRPKARAPHAEELAERRPSVNVDDTGGIERPQAGAATGRVHAAEPRSRSAQADRRRHDHDATVREELDMHALAPEKRCARAGRMQRRTRVVLRSDADRRRHEREHRLHGIGVVAFVGLVVLAGCGGGSSSSPTISVQPAREFRLQTQSSGVPTAGKPTRITYSIKQPDGSNLTKFKHGAGPHTGVHVIYVRDDLGAIVHHHPHIAANGSFTDTVRFPSGGPYRVVIDVYPQQSTPQPNFQLFNRLRVKGAYTPAPLPPPEQTQTVDGYRFSLHGEPRLRAIQPAFLSFTVTRPDGKPANFTPWFGALAHAIFFRRGSLDYFHTHVCAQGASGCTSLLGRAKVTGRSSTPGKLSVGVLVPVGGTWRLFLQCLVDGRVLTAPFTLQVR
jgi:hypothetical protein